MLDVWVLWLVLCAIVCYKLIGCLFCVVVLICVFICDFSGSSLFVDAFVLFAFVVGVFVLVCVLPLCWSVLLVALCLVWCCLFVFVWVFLCFCLVLAGLLCLI